MGLAVHASDTGAVVLTTHCTSSALDCLLDLVLAGVCKFLLSLKSFTMCSACQAGSSDPEGGGCAFSLELHQSQEVSFWDPRGNLHPLFVLTSESLEGITG